MMKKILQKFGFMKKIEEPTKPDFSEMSKAELKAAADELGVKVDMRKKRETIISILESSK